MIENKIVVGKADRTRRMIKDAFIELYSKEAIDRISVRQLVDEAGVTRSTFYCYFENVYDLLEKIEAELEQELSSFFSQSTRVTYGGESVAPPESSRQWFESCRNNKEYLRALLGPHGDSAFVFRLKKNLKDSIAVMMNQDGMPDDHLREYILEYLSSAIMELMRFSIRLEDDSCSVEQLAQIANLSRQGALILRNAKGA